MTRGRSGWSRSSILESGRSRGSRPPGFKRADAQLAVARLYGFASWAALRDHLRLVTDFTPSAPAEPDRAESADRFVSLACLTYDDVDVAGRLAEAAEMLAADPELSTSTVAAAAATGRHAALAAALTADPALTDRRVGPNDWPPLLYCTYSRVGGSGQEHSAVETVRLLLDAGADPNAGFLWHGLVPPFTALTGAFGRGERDEPAHPEAGELASLLLAAGADPNDGQALYNNGLAGSANDDPSHLEVLVAHGLGTDRGGPWYRRFGARLTPPVELLNDELEVAAHRGLPRRMRFLVGLGLDLERPVGRSGRTPAQLASDGGHQDVLAVLAEDGVDVDRPGEDGP